MFCSGRGLCGIQSNSPSSVHLPSLCWGYKGDIESCFVASFPLMLVCSFHLTLTPIRNMGSLGNMTDVRGAGWQGGYWCRSVELQTHTSGVAQCRYPRRTTWRAQLYVWRKKYQINFNVFSCLPLSSFFLKCVLLLNGLFISFVFLLSCYSTLQEADGADVHSKLLVSTSNVHGSNVHNGQSGRLQGFVLDDCLAPLACVFLWRQISVKSQQQLMVCGCD